MNEMNLPKINLSLETEKERNIVPFFVREQQLHSLNINLRKASYKQEEDCSFSSPLC